MANTHNPWLAAVRMNEQWVSPPAPILIDATGVGLPPEWLSSGAAITAHKLVPARDPYNLRADEIAAAVAAERTRIRAAIESVAPTETVYTRRDWAIEEKGARAHHAKVMAAIDKMAKESGG